MTIAFTTRSGTNRLSGSAYEYWRNPSLNTNYWFNERNGLPKNETKLNQYGVRVGGPIKIPGAVRRPRQGVLLLPLRRAALPEQLHAARARVHPDEVIDGHRSRTGSAA